MKAIFNGRVRRKTIEFEIRKSGNRWQRDQLEITPLGLTFVSGDHETPPISKSWDQFLAWIRK